MVRACKFERLYAGVAAGALIAGMGGVASAQDAAVGDEDGAEVIIVTGARGQERAVQDSPVPIDVIGAGELGSVSFTDTNDVLRTLVPSYSLARQPISDGGTFIRPASLRGLPTDKTLVLVNSLRRHRAALVQIGGDGTQGPDIATIPSSAIGRVEVLRDGAAAQYGSDAIAGVINFILKQDPDGGSLSVQGGKYYEDDGEQIVVSGNKGFALGADGFVNASFEFSSTQPTSRGTQYCHAFGNSYGGDFGAVGGTGGLPNNACVDDNINGIDTDGDGVSDLFGEDMLDNATGYPTPDGLPDYTDQRWLYNAPPIVQPWGQPESEAFRSFVNAAYPVSDLGELYGFGNYSYSEADGSFFYRYPGNGTIEYLRTEDGGLYSPLEKFPAGFTPRFFGSVIDYSAAGGFRGELDGGFAYDFYARYGRNEIQYTLKNTINPSLGPASPTVFHPGDLVSDEFGIGGDFSFAFDPGVFATPLTIAFGGEFRDEGYELVAGDEASVIAGPFAQGDPFGFCDGAAGAGATPTAAGLAVIANGSNLDCDNPADPVYTAVGVGSNGFPGYGDEFTGDFSRESSGVYVDVSTDVTSQLFVQLAARYEDYEDFGTTSDFKAAARFEFSPMFAIRGSASTGFRAPTPGQLFTTNVSTRLPNGFPVATGLFPASSTVAQVLGAEALAPEESTNYTIGFTSNPFSDLTLTVDFYRIELEDRMRAVSTITIVNDIDFPGTTCDPGDDFCELASTLDAAGVANANTIGGVNFFQNAFDTVTEGVDVVATYMFDWDDAGSTSVTGSLNYNTTEFDGAVDGTLFNAENRYDFENDTPKLRGVLTVMHSIGAFDILGRANYYGEYSNSDSGGASGNIQEFDPVVQFDLEGTWRIDDTYSLSLGARNIFDEYPDVADYATIGDNCCGRVYRSDSVVDWQGGFYYARMAAEF